MVFFWDPSIICFLMIPGVSLCYLVVPCGPGVSLRFLVFHGNSRSFLVFPGFSFYILVSLLVWESCRWPVCEKAGGAWWCTAAGGGEEPWCPSGWWCTVAVVLVPLPPFCCGQVRHSVNSRPVELSTGVRSEERHE